MCLQKKFLKKGCEAGVTVKDGCKTGLSKQANKSAVFTKDRLEHIQNVMRENCIKEFNKEYNENYTLKEKEKGRNKDIYVKIWLIIKN